MAESEPTAPRGAHPAIGFALALPLGLLPLLLPASPWSLLPLLLALPLQLSAAAWALGHRAAPTLGGLVLGRAWISLVVLVLGALLLSVLLAWPVGQLLVRGSLTATLLASAAVAVGGLVVWRWWPAALLPLIDPPRATRRPGPLTRALRDGRALAEADPSAGRGLLATVILLLLILAVLGLGLGDARLSSGTRLLAFPLWTLLAPFLSFALLALVEPARLASTRTPTGHLPSLSAAASEPELMLPAGLDPSARLYATARTGRVELALAELESGADPHALPDPGQRDQRTVAMLASVLGDLRLLRGLIARGVDLNRRHAGLTPLLAATRDSLHGRPEAVMTLLANGADPRAADAEGRTPLHFAALLADPEVAALLLDANADIDACNRDGYSPLGVACGSGNWRMARFLLERKARPEPVGGQPALLAAASGEDDPAGVMLLLRHKAAVDARGRLGRTALMSACLAGNVEIAGALLAAGADVDARDEHAVTPLLEAARAGATAVLERLAAARPDAGCRDHSGRSAMLVACQSAQASGATIDALLKLGVDPEAAADDGRRPIDVAIASGRWPLVARLDPAYPLPSCHDGAAAETLAQPIDDPRPWRERLHGALLDNDVAAVDALLASDHEVAACGELFDALAPRLTPTLVRRLAAHVDPDSPDASGNSRLWHCLAGASAEAIDALRERGAAVGGRGGLARYLAACLQHLPAPAGAEARARQLLEAGADGFGSVAGDAPIHLALRLGWLDLLQDLLARGADPQAPDARGETPLVLAASRRCLAALPVLLRHGAQPEAPTRDGRTARGIALAQGSPEAIDWLDWSGWKPPGRPLRPADLVAAATQGDRAAVRRLLALGLAVDAVDAQGASALLRASGSGHAELVADLLAAGADPARPANSGATCLSAAVSRRQLKVIAVLLAHGVPAEQPLPGGISPLMVAAALGFPDVCAALLKAGANPRAMDQQGNAATHALAQFGFSTRERARALATWSLLLEAGTAHDARNGEGLSPLLLLLGTRVEPGANPDEDCLAAQVELLLARSAALDARDGRGYTPLHLAALHGQLRIVRRLLAAGADREARDTLNRRPQELALMRGFVDIARELEPASGGVPSLARLLRDPSR